jgi:hypothetical protein
MTLARGHRDCMGTEWHDAFADLRRLLEVSSPDWHTFYRPPPVSLRHFACPGKCTLGRFAHGSDTRALTEPDCGCHLSCPLLTD